MPKDHTSDNPNVAPIEKPSPKKPASTGGFKRALIKFGVLLALLGGAYGFGRCQSAQASSVLEQVRLRAQQLEARRQLHLALMALEDRNFGTAQKTLSLAGSMLAKGEPSEGLAKLAGEIANYKFMAGEDISTDRQKLIGWTLRFDELVKPAL